MRELVALFQRHGVRYAVVGGHAVNIISLDHLVETKKYSDRPRDQADADELIKINRKP